MLWPISIIIDLFLKIKHHFWPDNSVRILNYHSISSEIKGKRMKHISVSPEVFAAQMKYLADNSFQVISLDDLLQWKETNHPIPPKCIILSFDDGFEDNYLHFAFNDRGWMHWPEYCLRIYRNLDYIRWVGEIHESIQGCKAHLQIEPSEDYAIIHEKSISKQIISDEYYNTFEHHRNLHNQNLENRKRVVEAKLESIRFNSEQGFE